jgi:hypothetical protein
MSYVLAPTATTPALGRSGWRLRNNPKLDLWIAWYVMVIFYLLFGVVFVLMTKVMPPPGPDWSSERILRWFSDNRGGLLNGYAGVVDQQIQLTHLLAEAASRCSATRSSSIVACVRVQATSSRWPHIRASPTPTSSRPARS